MDKRRPRQAENGSLLGRASGQAVGVDCQIDPGRRESLTLPCPTLPVWRQEAVPTREIDSSSALLNGWRSLPAPRPAELSPWNPLRTRFANGAARFINRPSPYAVPAPLPRPHWVYRETGIGWITLGAVPALDARVCAGCRGPGHRNEAASTSRRRDADRPEASYPGHRTG